MRLALRAAVAAIVLLFLAFVWPTPFRYFASEERGIVRLNRFTGTATILTDSGWVALRANPLSDLLPALRGQPRPAAP